MALLGNLLGGGLVGGVVDTVDDVLDDLLGDGSSGGSSGSGGPAGSGGGSGGANGGGAGGGTGDGSGGIIVGNLVNTRVLDGLVNLELLNDDTILDLSLVDQDSDGDGLVDISLLDPDGDGLIDVGVLDDSISATVIDQDGDGLIDIEILDLIDIEVGGDGGSGGGDNGGDIDGGTGPGHGGPGGSTNPGAYDQVLIGTMGRDHFTIGNEATFADGLAAVDTASYGVDSEGYTYLTTANGVFISDGDKVDYLQDVERVKFSDGTLVLDTDVGENAGMAYRIYQAAFDRMPDVGGLKFYIDELDNGKLIEQIAADFLWSNEFRQTYGTNLTNEQFVDELYENILNRDGEEAGVNYWVNELNSGTQDRAKVLASFSESQENIDLVGAYIADGFFLA